MPVTQYADQKFERGWRTTGTFDGLFLHDGARPKEVFNLTAKYEHPERGLQVDLVGQTYSEQIAERWVQSGDLPEKRTDKYVPVLTRQHIFGFEAQAVGQIAERKAQDYTCAAA